MNLPNEEPEIEILSSAPEHFPDEVAPSGAPPVEPGVAPVNASEASGDEDWKARHDELMERMKWLGAEFENYKKRALKERDEHLRFANTAILKEFLGVADNLERALLAIPHVDLTGPAVGLKQGVDLTLRSFQGVLQKHGVTRIPAKGEKFDPHLHQVMFEEKTDQAPDDTVLEELQAGYMLHDRVLRPTMVKVARNPNLA